MNNDIFLQSDFIERVNLIKKIKKISLKKPFFLNAPSGSGKTVSVKQFIISTKSISEWITLNQGFNNPYIFYKSLVQSICHLADWKNISKFKDFNNIEDILTMINNFPKKKKRGYLIIDNFHLLINEEIIENFAKILEVLPSYIRVGIVGQNPPTSVLYHNDLIDVIDMDELNFSIDEIKSLYKERNKHITEKQAEKLRESTGGWIIALNAIIKGDIENINLKNHNIEQLFEYFDNYIWPNWDYETKKVLISFSIAKTISTKLIEKLFKTNDSMNFIDKIQKEIIFLDRIDENSWRLHDLFISYFNRHINSLLSITEIVSIHNIIAEYHFEQKEYLDSMNHYISSENYDGIRKCTLAILHFTSLIPIDMEYHFFKNVIANLSDTVVLSNLYLLAFKTWYNFLDGDAMNFTKHLSILLSKTPTIIKEAPEMISTILLLNTLNFNIDLKDSSKLMHDFFKKIPPQNNLAKEVMTPSVTHSFPYFHRSTRDYSENYKFEQKELNSMSEVYSLAMGKDYEILRLCLVAGLNYEKNDLISAIHFATTAYKACSDDMHPETIFTVHATISAVLEAMGSSNLSDKYFNYVENYIENGKGAFIKANYNALKVIRSIKRKDIDTAQEWLSNHSRIPQNLTYYRIVPNFATLHSFLLVCDYESAVTMGNKLQKLSMEYKRPLDMIESTVLVSIALYNLNKKHEATAELENAINIAMKYDYTQQFINYGKELLQVFWLLKLDERPDSEFKTFAKKIKSKIYYKYDLIEEISTTPKLTNRQHSILMYLSQGMDYDEISKETGLARGTIKNQGVLKVLCFVILD